MSIFVVVSFLFVMYLMYANGGPIMVLVYFNTPVGEFWKIKRLNF